MGDVIVRLVVNKRNGTYKTEIVGHENGALCGDGVDADIVEDLMNAEVPGFGHLSTHDDSGKTCEHFEEKAKKSKPHAYNQGDDDEDGDDEMTSKKKKLDLGYGV